MEYTIIEVPDMNDSVSRIVLNDTVYFIRFTYNDTADYWKVSLYDAQNEPIVLGIKIVPRFPLNTFYPVSKLPDGIFAVITQLDHVGRNDFVEDKAQFIFCPLEE
ncbi:phage baseplate plug family protein [Anaerotignum faecicola]